MMNLFSKKILIPISIAIILSAGFLVWFSVRQYHLETEFPSGNSVSKQISNLLTSQFDTSLPSEIALSEQESIPLTWTDNNDNENLIIKTDRQYYDAGEQTEIFFSITNTTSSDQKTDVYFWFDDGQKSVASVGKIEGGQISNFQFPISNQFTMPQFPNRKSVKNYISGSKFQDTIVAGQTNYYHAIVKFPKGTNGEFFVEAFGKPFDCAQDNCDESQLAYGHLDPYYASGLVGMWSFSGADTNWTSATAGTTNDLSGNNNTGTMTNMSRSSSPKPGISGQALSFDGTDDYMNAGSGSSLDNLTIFTWSAWIYPTGWGEGSFGRIIGKTTTGGYEKAIYLNNGTAPLASLRAALFNSALTEFTTNTTANSISLNQWHHLVATYNDNGDRKLHIYINGVEASYDSQPALTGTLWNDSAENLGIGNRGNTDRTFNGLIDEVRVYNRALSAAEVSDLYRLGASRLKANSPTTGYLTSGLVGEWSFNGANTNWTSATAGTTNDLSGNNNTGTMTNMSRSTSPVPGISGQALNFDGSDDYVNAGSQSSLDDITAMTVTAWIKPKSFGEGPSFGRIAEKIQGTTNGWQWLVCNDVTNCTQSLNFICYFTGPIAASWNSANNSIATNVWQFVAVTYDRSSTANDPVFYVNGTVISTTEKVAPSGSALTDAANTLTIGNRTATDRSFDGVIDEVRVYNRALGASEITDLYRLGTRKFQPTR